MRSLKRLSFLLFNFFFDKIFSCVRFFLAPVELFSFTFCTCICFWQSTLGFSALTNLFPKSQKWTFLKKNFFFSLLAPEKRMCSDCLSTYHRVLDWNNTKALRISLLLRVPPKADVAHLSMTPPSFFFFFLTFWGLFDVFDDVICRYLGQWLQNYP